MDLTLFLIGLVVAAATFSVALLLQMNLTRGQATVQQRILAGGGLNAGGPTPFIAIPTLETLSARSQKIRDSLDKAGVNLTVTEFMVVRTVVAVSGGMLLAILSDKAEFGTVVRIIALVVGFAAGYAIPGRYIEGRRLRRMAVIEDQVLDALVSMAKSLRSGLGLSQALDFAARECDEPLGPELVRVVREIQLGGDIEAVFADLNARIGSPDLEIASTAIMIQRRVGGSLSEILTNVSNTIRERRDLRSEVRILTSRHKLTGNVSAALPVLVAIAFFVGNPDVANLLLTETAGRIALAVGIFFEIFGLWLIRKLAVVEV